MDMIAKAPLLLSSSPQARTLVDNTFSDRTQSNNVSARNSTHGSDDIFDKYSLRSPINGSESEYEDEEDIISQMPADSNAPSCYDGEIQENETHDFTQHTPSRRSPFRNPSSVRGMQLETTPPHLRSSTLDSINKHRGRISIGSRNSTPRSVHSYRSRSPAKLKPPTKKENPLILLHVTILPISCSYSQALLQEFAPSHVLQNWKLLREKVPTTVLERGILIPHPREEFELLEERLLESLDLAVPKILKCGHFHRETIDNEESEPEQREASQISCDHENESDADSDICIDCTCYIRDGSKGSNGTGKRRWNMHIYAANGLMRAGAWSAAWKEMERVDVEISPWLDDDLRRTLDLRKAQDDEEIALQIAEEQHRQQQHNLHAAVMDESRHREIYGDTSLPSNIHTERNFTPGEIVEAYEHIPVHDDQEQEFLASHSSRYRPFIRIPKRGVAGAGTPHSQDIPITELLTNYIKLLFQDQRNIALAFLSVLVVWLAVRSVPVYPAQVAVPDVVAESFSAMASARGSVSASISSVVGGFSSTFTDVVAGSLPTSLMEMVKDDDGGGCGRGSDPSIEIEISSNLD